MNIYKWSDRLFEASFRDVKFNILKATASGGRRGPNHEFTNRDVPYAEDMGRSQRAFTITGFVIGGGEKGSEHYFEKRNKLIAACEKRGSGELSHPYFGKLSVVCRS